MLLNLIVNYWEARLGAKQFRSPHSFMGAGDPAVF